MLGVRILCQSELDTARNSFVSSLFWPLAIGVVVLYAAATVKLWSYPATWKSVVVQFAMTAVSAAVLFDGLRDLNLHGAWTPIPFTLALVCVVNAAPFVMQGVRGRNPDE